MNRRHFLKLAGFGALFSVTGLKALTLGPKLGERYRSGDRLLLVVRNDSGEALEVKRIVRYREHALLGYAQSGDSHMGVMTERAKPGQVTAINIHGLAWMALARA